jgi:gas vesicle protein GvpA/GvpJ/GvpM family
VSALPEFANPNRSHGLVDILDRVLDKGLVVAGDIKINLANVELLTIQIRLLVCSIDKAEQIGLNWWRNDPRLTATPVSLSASPETEERLKNIERQLQRLVADTEPKRKGGGK